MEHSLWTQVRNKIQAEGSAEVFWTRNKIQAEGSAEVFWTDVCIPRDTIMYYPWGYRPLKQNPLTEFDHVTLTDIIQGLIQVGGQANVGRGWVQSWSNNITSPLSNTTVGV
jgi:CRISPR-associated protein Cmr4